MTKITVTGQLTFSGGQLQIAPNKAPTWVSAENLGSNHEAVTITAANYAVVATDPENDPLTYSFVSGTLPTGATLNSNGTITGPAVSVASNTTFNFTARVSDGVSSVDKAFFITVNQNASPVWSTSAALGSVDENTAVNIQLTATDADSLPLTLTYSVVSGALPSGVTLNTSTGLLTGTAPEETGDTLYMFTVRASDGLDTADRQFSLTVAQVFVVDETFTTSGSYIVPAGISVLELKMWGAAGGGSTDDVGDFADQIGGAGGFISANVAVTAGETLTITVGTAGGESVNNAVGAAGSPGGATGGNASSKDGAGGGGRTELLRSTTRLLIAGAGGGAGNHTTTARAHGGAGGGTTGELGQGGSGGDGGSQVAGGAAGDASAVAGSSLTGGAGSGDSVYGGGGGGAGFFGGGGGGSTPGVGGGGGGGSGFILDDPGITNGVNTQGDSGTGLPPNQSDPDYVAGKGVGVATGASGDGFVVILI